MQPGQRIKALKTDRFHQFIQGDVLEVVETKDELGLGSLTANNLTRPKLTETFPAVLILNEYTTLEVEKV